VQPITSRQGRIDRIDGWTKERTMQLVASKTLAHYRFNVIEQDGEKKNPLRRLKTLLAVH